MNPGGAIFALANPTPRFTRASPPATPPWSRPGAATSPTRSNVLAFPGVFRWALDAGATTITEAMKVAAAEARGVVANASPRTRSCLATRPRVAPAVAAAVSAAWAAG